MIEKSDHQQMDRSRQEGLHIYHHFSKDNDRMLKAVNDVTVQPHCSFLIRGHKKGEMLMYVVQGELTHQANEKPLKRGSLQVMSSDIKYCERNDADTLLRLIQIEIGSEDDLMADDGHADLLWRDRYNQWLLIASGEWNEAPIFIQQDMNVYAAELSDAMEKALEVKPSRQLYLIVLEGRVRIEDILFDSHDAAVITESTHVKAASWAHLLLLEMPINKNK